MKYGLESVGGWFIADASLKVIGYEANVTQKTLTKKYKKITIPNEKQQHKIQGQLKSEKYLSILRKAHIADTIIRVRESVDVDDKIIQAVHTKRDSTKIINMVAARLRDWQALFIPEASQIVDDHLAFANFSQKTRKQMFSEIKLREHASMGAQPDKADEKYIKNLGAQLEDLFNEQKQQEDYLDKIVQKHARNVYGVCGSIAAVLIEEAGSLRKLAFMPSGTVQLLGAKKALFRHLKTRARSPKHGIILQHQFVQKAKNKGKAARMLANKISVAARLDFFGGKYMADELNKELEDARS